MGHRRTPEAESDLDEIWCYLASKSGNLNIADRFIDSITDRFASTLSASVALAGVGVAVKEIPLEKSIHIPSGNYPAIHYSNGMICLLRTEGLNFDCWKLLGVGLGGFPFGVSVFLALAK